MRFPSSLPLDQIFSPKGQKRPTKDSTRTSPSQFSVDDLVGLDTRFLVKFVLLFYFVIGETCGSGGVQGTPCLPFSRRKFFSKGPSSDQVLLPMLLLLLFFRSPPRNLS